MKDYDSIKKLEITNLQKVTLAKDDVLVAKISSSPTVQQLESVKNYLQAIFPKTKVLIIDNSIELGVITYENESVSH